MLQAGAGEVGTTQVGFFQVGQVEPGVTQVGAGEIGAGQVDAAEVEVAQVGAAQVGLGAARAGLQAAAGDDADVVDVVGGLGQAGAAPGGAEEEGLDRDTPPAGKAAPRRARRGDQRLAVRLSQLGSLNTQKEPPWATGRVRSAMSPPHSGTAPP